MAALCVKPSILDVGFEGVWISLHDESHGDLSFLVSLFVRAVATLAIGATTKSKSKAITVELETLGFLTVADRP